MPHCLIACGAGVAAFVACEHINDPVACFDELIGAVVKLGSLVQKLPCLCKEPFAGDLSAVAGEADGVELAGKGVYLVGFGLGGVVLPKLNVGVGIVFVFGEDAERSAVGQDRDHGAGGKVNAYADDVCRIDLRLGENGGNGLCKDLKVITRVLQSPVGRKLRHSVGKVFVHNGVGIVLNSGCNLFACFDLNKQGSAAEGAKVNTDGIFHG